MLRGQQMPTSDKYLALVENVLPVLVDNTQTAHRISARIFNRHKIVSFICGKRRFLDIFDISCKTLRLPDSSEKRLIVEELIEFVKNYSDMIPVLIPCSERAEAVVHEFSEELEAYYIIADPNVFMDSSPIENLVRILENP